MKSRSFQRSLVLFMISYNLLLRSSYIHVHGGDAWAILFRTRTVEHYGMITWIIDIASYFGWSLYTYPSGTSVIYPALNLICGFNPLIFIYTISLFTTFLGLLGVFILVRTLTHNKWIMYITLFSLATMKTYLDYTFNNSSARGLFIAFYPIVLFSLIVSYEKYHQRLNYVLISLMGMVTLASIHRIFYYFILIFLLPLIILLIYNTLSRRISFKSPLNSSNGKSLLVLVGCLLFFGQILGVTIIDFHSYNLLSERGDPSNLILSNDNFLYILINFFYFYIKKYNLSVIFLPFGFLFLTLINYKTVAQKLILYSTLIAILFVFDTMYFSVFFVPVGSILVAFGLYGFHKWFQARELFIKRTAIFLLILTTIPFALYYVSKGYMYPLIMILLGIFILFRLIFSSKSNYSTVSPSLLIAFILIVSSHSISVTIYRSFDESADFDNSKGDYVIELKGMNRARWVGNNLPNEHVMIENGSAQNVVLVNSNLENPMPLGLNLFIYDVFVAEYEPFFSLESLIKVGRVAFVTNPVNERHDPAGVWSQIMNGNTELSKSYEVSWFLMSTQPFAEEKYRDEREAGGCVSCGTGMSSYLSENRYVPYKDHVLTLYYFDSYP